MQRRRHSQCGGRPSGTTTSTTQIRPTVTFAGISIRMSFRHRLATSIFIRHRTRQTSTKTSSPHVSTQIGLPSWPGQFTSCGDKHSTKIHWTTSTLAQTHRDLGVYRNWPPHRVTVHSGRRADSRDLVVLAAGADFDRIATHLHRGKSEKLAGRIETVLDRLMSEDFADAFNGVFEQQTVPE